MSRGHSFNTGPSAGMLWSLILPVMWQKKTSVPEWLLLVYNDILELDVQCITFLSLFYHAAEAGWDCITGLIPDGGYISYTLLGYIFLCGLQWAIECLPPG